MNPEDITVAGVRTALASGSSTAEAITRACLDRIAAHDDTIHAFLAVFADRAIERAGAVDARIAGGESPESIGAMAGVPVAIKDNICLDHGRTTAASVMLEAYESPFSATAAARLEDAGAIILGKTNLDEFGMGSSCEYSAFGATRNPWDISRTPGGSSGGSAAAVAAGFVPVALGSDTGGSVRQPAAMCGCIGLKPSYGTVSRHGLIAYASSLDQIGPMTRTVEDAAAVLEVIAGADADDATCLDRPAPKLTHDLHEPVEGLKIAVPRQAQADAVDPMVRLIFGMSCKVFAELGAELMEVELDHAELAIPAYYTIACAEASTNLARYDGIRFGRRAEIGPNDPLEELYIRSRSEGFGPEVRRRIMLGTHALRAGFADKLYERAMRARRVIKADYDAIFRVMQADAVLTPTAPGPAFELGSRAGAPTDLYLEDTFTVGANLAGLPAISLPAGFVPSAGGSLPVGIQLTGHTHSEAKLLRIAAMFERASSVGGRVAV